MSLFFKRDLGDTPNQLVPQRSARTVGSVFVSNETAMRHSAVWACLRIRADLVSTMQLKPYRDVALPDGGTVKANVPPTPFLRDPAGDGFGVNDWLYSSQIDLDRAGNTFGIVRARDGNGLASVVELAPLSQVTVKGKGPQITSYRIAGTDYDPRDVWHERAFTVAGMPLGLAPLSFAQLSIGQYLSAQDFGLQWFANGRVPTASLRNKAKTLKPDEADLVKRRFKEALEGRDIFVTGNDWEYDMLAVAQNESQFIELMRYGVLDIARFMGVPGDLIDAEAQSSAKITYANITQRNLQLLVINLAPTLVRRERMISRALAAPRYVEFDPSSSILRMDPQTRAAVNSTLVESRQRTPSEVRETDGYGPYTDDQLAEFDRLFPKAPPGAPKQAGARVIERDAHGDITRIREES